MHGFGNMLRDYLEYYKISQSDFADRLGITQKHMNEIINGKTRISPELMVVISLLTDIDVNLIFFVEKTKDVYDLLLDKYGNEKEINDMLNSYYLNEMAKQQWLRLNVASSFVYNYIDLINYSGINDIENYKLYLNKRYLYHYIDELSDDDKLKIFLWARHCEIISKGIEICDYDSSKFDGLINELKKERMNKFDKDRLIKLFHKYGIILCIEDPLKNTKVRGCVRVMVNTPAIFMTRTMKEKSEFYFTLYHELIHLKRDYNKLKSKTIVQGDINAEDIDSKALSFMVDDEIYNKILNDFDNREKIALSNNIPLDFLYLRLVHDKKVKQKKYKEII